MSNDLLKKTKAWLVEEVESLQRENQVLREAWEKGLTRISELKREIEGFQLTPEVKADTEAAFKRGYALSRRNLFNGLQATVEKLAREFEDENGSPPAPVPATTGIMRTINMPESCR